MGVLKWVDEGRLYVAGNTTQVFGLGQQSSRNDMIDLLVPCGFNCFERKSQKVADMRDLLLVQGSL